MSQQEVKLFMGPVNAETISGQEAKINGYLSAGWSILDTHLAHTETDPSGKNVTGFDLVVLFVKTIPENE